MNKGDKVWAPTKPPYPLYPMTLAPKQIPKTVAVNKFVPKHS